MSQPHDLLAFGMEGSIDWVTMGKWAILIAIVLVLTAGAVVVLAGQLIEPNDEWAKPAVLGQQIAGRIQVFGNFIPRSRHYGAQKP